MELFEIIGEGIKSAMLAKDKIRLEALRGAKKEFLEAKTAKGSDGTLTDDMAIKIIQKMIKQRKDSASIFKEQNRSELAEKELAEVLVLEEYLPKQLSAEDLKAIVASIIERIGATSIQDMGKVMSVASKELAGKSEGRLISECVKQLLA